MEQPPANVQSPRVFLKARCWDLCSFQSTLIMYGITEVSISANSYRVLYADNVLLYRGISIPEEDIHMGAVRYQRAAKVV